MSDVLFIAPTELAMAIRLAGGAVVPVRTVADLREAVEGIGEESQTPVAVLAPEHLAMQLEPNEIRSLLAADTPFFIFVPMEWQGKVDARADLEDRLRYLLGFRIPLPDVPSPEGGAHASPQPARSARAGESEDSDSA